MIIHLDKQDWFKQFILIFCLFNYTAAAPLDNTNNESDQLSNHIIAEEAPEEISIGQINEPKIAVELDRPRLYVNEDGIIVVPIEHTQYKELYVKSVTKRSLLKKKKKKCKKCSDEPQAPPVILVPVTVNTGSGGGCKSGCHPPPPKPKPCGGTCGGGHYPSGGGGGYYPSGGGGGQSFAQASASATATAYGR